MQKYFTIRFFLWLWMIPVVVLAGAGAEDITLVAPDGKSVEIHRDSYGVPHIKSDTETGIFFGQGFAAAQDRLVQMEDLRLAALGKTAMFGGPSFRDFDKFIRTYYYTEEERQSQFNELDAELQNAFTSYIAGVNTYIDSMIVNPQKYKALEFIIRPYSKWKVTDSIALAQFMIRNFGWFGGTELDRLAERQQNGQAWFDEHRPINYAGAPTTIPAGEAANLPKTNWKYAGIRVQKQVVEEIRRQRQAYEQQARALGVPKKFGSFAVLITPSKSNNGEVMLLGCPQMGTPQRDVTSIVNEVELICPTYHAGGMTIAGLPGVIIGRNEYHAWSFTSGNSDNSDVYIETTQDASMSKYQYNGEWRDFEVIQDTINVFGQPEAFSHYRTVHGPVFGADLTNKQVYSEKMTFWNDEISMFTALYGMASATNLAEFEAAARLNPMSFNLFYAGKDQNVKFWHIGRYQDRSDNVDPRLPHNGDGSQEWRGFIPFSELPSLQNPAQGYLVNWNNKPVSWWNNGDNVPWRAEADTVSSTTFRVNHIERYVGPLNEFSFQNLKDTPFNIQSHGTYQQALSFSTTEVTGANVLPPGQSAFVSMAVEPSPHKNDQWDLHVNWQFKEMIFGENVTTDVALAPAAPATFELLQNYPNPFNPETKIAFRLPTQSRVVLKIYNIQGQLVRTIIDQKYEPGAHQITWDGVGAQGYRVSSGIYIYKIETDAMSQARRMVFIK
ncbi:MAG: penicillin acylase family protein [bacterium]